jgi:hypothetical protein
MRSKAILVLAGAVASVSACSLFGTIGFTGGTGGAGGSSSTISSSGGAAAPASSSGSSGSASSSSGTVAVCTPACSNTNGTNTCVGGTCVPTCATGFGDCDGNPANGCETDVTTDTNCGTCGTVCPAYAPCAGGICFGCSGSPPAVLTEASFGFTPGASDGFGWAVAMDGATVVAQATLTPSSPGADLYLGAPALSGDTIVVPGAVFDTTASAQHFDYVFVRSGTAWSQQATLIPGGLAPNGSPAFHVAGAFQGDLAVLTTTLGTYVFERSGTTWTQQPSQPLLSSVGGGSSAALRGSAMLIGAASYNGGYGNAYLLGLKSSVWTQGSTLMSGPPPGDDFGTSVALGQGTAVVGAPNASVGTISGAGALFVFQCSP